MGAQFWVANASALVEWMILPGLPPDLSIQIHAGFTSSSSAIGMDG
jgi:hypothetical protein